MKRQKQKEAETVGRTYEPKNLIFKTYKNGDFQVLKRYNLVGDEIAEVKRVTYDSLPFMKKSNRK